VRCFSCLEKIDRENEDWSRITLVAEATGNKFDVSMHGDCVENKDSKTGEGGSE
jgi:hypothetical protein